MSIDEFNLKNINNLVKDLKMYLKEKKHIQEEVFLRFKNNIKNENDLIDFFYEKIKKGINYSTNLNIYIKIINEFIIEKNQKENLLKEIEELKQKYILDNPILGLNNDLINLDLKNYYKALEVLDNKELDNNIKNSIKNSINNIIESRNKEQKESKTRKSTVIKNKYDEFKYIEKRNKYLDKKAKKENTEKLYKEYEDIFNTASELYIRYLKTYAKENGYDTYFEYKFRNEKISRKILENLQTFYNENKENIEYIKNNKNINVNKIYEKEDINNIKSKLIKMHTDYFNNKNIISDKDIVILFKKNSKNQKCILSQNKYILIINVNDDKEKEKKENKESKEKIKLDFNGLWHEFSHAVFLKEYLDTNKIIPFKIIQETFAIFSEILLFEENNNEQQKNKKQYIKRIFELFIKPINIISDTYKMEKGKTKADKDCIETYINYFIQAYISFEHFISAVLAINMYIEYNKNKQKQEYIEKILKNNEDSIEKYFKKLNINIYNKNIYNNALKYFNKIGKEES